jgi:uncharacterized protein (TIGR02145 family)
MKKVLVFIATCIIISLNGNAQRWWHEINADSTQGTFIDTRDSNTYKWVKIGDQIWMAENLNFGTKVMEGKRLNKNIIEKLCYDNNENNCDTFGGLYIGYTMNHFNLTQGPNGICPEGWHIPTDKEWQIQVDYLGGNKVAGGLLKEAGTAHWDKPNIGATNSSRFAALPGGFFDISLGRFVGKSTACYFWSSSFSWVYAVRGFSYWNRNLNKRNSVVRRNLGLESSALSVRCIKDN